MSDPVAIGLAASLALLLAMVVALLFRGSAPRPRPRRTTTDAFHRLLLGDREGARSILAEVVRDGDAPAEAYLRLGDLLREDGHAERALALHQGVLARPDLDVEQRRQAEVAVADDLLAMDRPREALARLEKLDRQFLDPGLMARHALALHRCGRVEEAAARLIARAREGRAAHKAEAARYLAEMGREALRQGDAEKARQRARRALEIDPDSGAAHLVLGAAQLQQGRTEEAGMTWREGLRRSPSSGPLLLPRLLDVAQRGGSVDRLLDGLEALHREHPDDPNLWKAVADLRLRRGDLESFFAIVEDAPTRAEADLPTWAGWMRHLGARGDREALARLLKAMPPSFGPARWRCAHCGHQDGEPREACARCGRLDPLRGEGPAVRPRTELPASIEGAGP